MPWSRRQSSEAAESNAALVLPNALKTSLGVVAVSGLKLSTAVPDHQQRQRHGSSAIHAAAQFPRVTRGSADEQPCGPPRLMAPSETAAPRLVRPTQVIVINLGDSQSNFTGRLDASLAGMPPARNLGHVNQAGAAPLRNRDHMFDPSRPLGLGLNILNVLGA